MCQAIRFDENWILVDYIYFYRKTNNKNDKQKYKKLLANEIQKIISKQKYKKLLANKNTKNY
jgi:hypothetical protein